MDDRAHKRMPAVPRVDPALPERLIFRQSPSDTTQKRNGVSEVKAGLGNEHPLSRETVRRAGGREAQQRRR
jgi:hypothetical protein